MRIEIDQSIKIEQTSKDTVVGLSNDMAYAVVLTSKVKRKLQEEFRRMGKPRIFVCRTFIAAVVLLLHHAGATHHDRLIIDQEYIGCERLLSSMFLEMWSRYSLSVPVFEFKKIGRRSGAHCVSHATMRGKRKAERVLEYGEVRRLAIK